MTDAYDDVVVLSLLLLVVAVAVPILLIAANTKVVEWTTTTTIRSSKRQLIPHSPSDCFPMPMHPERRRQPARGRREMTVVLPDFVATGAVATGAAQPPRRQG